MVRAVSLVALASFASGAMAQVGIDGSIGAEWSGPGVTTRSISYNAAAPTSNFGSPTGQTNNVAYDTYFRADANFVYAAVAARPDLGGSINGLQFANLYFSTLAPSNGSIAMEVNNDRFFRGGITTGGPNNDGYYPNGGLATWSSNASSGVIEVAIPVSFFLNDPLGMGFATSSGQLRWNLSQSLGYSVAGGAGLSTPGGPDDRLGLVTIPAPGAAALLGLGGLLASRRRR